MITNLSRFVVWVGVFLFFVIGLALVIAGAILYKQNPLGIEDPTFYKFYSSVMLIVIIIGLALIVATIFGLSGLKCAKAAPFLFTIYNIFIIALIITTVVLGMAAIVLKVRSLSTNICQTSFFDNLNRQFTTVGREFFCQSGCKCFIVEPAHFPIARNWSQEITDPVRVQECANFAITFPDLISVVGFAEFIEENGNCSGICTPMPYYLFTNINRGVPNNSCLTFILNFARPYTKYVIVISFTLASILLLQSLFVCCLCCCLKPKPNFNQFGAQGYIRDGFEMNRPAH